MTTKTLRNRGQKELYRLILLTLCQGKEIPRNEYIAIYREHVEREPGFGWQTTDMQTGEVKRGYALKAEHWRDDNADAWVVRTLGLFVKRGLLVVQSKSNAESEAPSE
jgi:hypothetical protein